MQTEPQKEHQWLQQLVGEWTYEAECLMGPDQPPTKSAGREVVRSLGGLWVMAEAEGEAPDGGTAVSIITLGYDPQKSRFVGTFVASIMAYLWVYEGVLGATGKTLTLAAEGPHFGGSGVAKYHDTIELIDEDNRALSSEMQGEDGKWHRFMTIRYQRIK